MKIQNATIGGDTEFMLQDKNTKEIVSAEGLIKGTKHEPFFFEKENPFFATSLDNVSAEISFPPCKDEGEYYIMMKHAMEFIQSTIPSNLILAPIASARLDPKYLQTENAQKFGCESSLSAWTMEEIRPQPTGDTLRCNGHHTHIGYDNPTLDINLELGKVLDLYLGIPSILIEPKNERKRVGYGCAGNIRLKTYGRENKNTYNYFRKKESRYNTRKII